MLRSGAVGRYFSSHAMTGETISIVIDSCLSCARYSLDVPTSNTVLDVKCCLRDILRIRRDMITLYHYNVLLDNRRTLDAYYISNGDKLDLEIIAPPHEISISVDDHFHSIEISSNSSTKLFDTSSAPLDACFTLNFVEQKGSRIVTDDFTSPITAIASSKRPITSIVDICGLEGAKARLVHVILAYSCNCFI